MAEGKGIEPLPVTVARFSRPLCHLDATLYLAESTRIELDALTHNLFSKQLSLQEILLSFGLVGELRTPNQLCRKQMLYPIELIRDKC